MPKGHYNLIFVDGSPGDLDIFYEELTRISSKQESRKMSEQTKKQVQEAQKFFKEVTERSKEYQQAIPDKGLGEKLRKVEQGSQEVVKHIEEKIGQNG